jgi:hypothetical protein
MDPSIQQRVAAALAQLGLPAPTNVIQTMLIKDRYFVGWKLRYDGGHAVLHAVARTIDLYDERPALLKTIDLNAEQEAA